MKEIDNRKVFTGFLWRLAERCGAQGVSFIVSIILARLLIPEVYGIVALITVFTSILQVFVESGFGNALIQKKDVDNLDFSTVFFFNLVFSVFLYVIAYLCAPLLARFYNDISMIPLIRTLSLIIIFSGVGNILQAYVSKYMMFRKFFFATLGGTLLSAIVGIGLAYAGFGVWALVFQQLTNSLVNTIILWVIIKWRPIFNFSFKRLKTLFSFGWKLLLSRLIDVVYNDARQLIIGKYYSSSDLAHYNKGHQLPNLIINNVNMSIDSVLFPAMSNVQDVKESVKNMTRRSIRICTYIIAPLMIGMASVATPLINLLLTSKWEQAIFYLRIFCITYIFYPMHTANLNAIKAMGRSDIFLKLEVLKKFIGVALLLSSMWFGVMAMAYSLLISSVLSQLINTWPNKKLLNYGYLQQLKDILPSILLAVIMGFCVYPICLLGLSDIFTVIIQVVFGAIIYIGGSVLFKLDSFLYCWAIIRNFIFNKKKV